MAMYVFSPAEAKSRIDQRAEKDAKRAESIIQTTKELLATQAEAERSFAETMEQQKKEAAQWFEEHQAQKRKLEEEIKELIARREKAVSPLLIEEGDIHSVQEALIVRELQLREQERELEEESRLLMRKLDEVSDKEQDLTTREKTIKRKEDGVRIQQEQIKKSSELLNQKTEEFQRDMAEKETQFAYRQSELDAEANLWKQKNDLLVQREEELEAGKRLLADQRVLLDKGFAELRKELFKKHG